ncbi:MAG: hypothetical protein IIV97_03370 [Oscillospiraceae bacterium]|nr:hypothetical protein [Oscillospiraceae bacterium]
MEKKRVLLIAGGGTLGTHTAKELLRLGHQVEIICPEEKVSDNENLTFHRSLATEEFLRDLFSKNHYDGIVNFIHYPEASEYKKVHPLLIENTDHLIFLSSYRVYADEVRPIVETAPRLIDVSKDTAFLEEEKYAVSKARCEDYLYSECLGQPWTVVRPVISFSTYRFDLYMYSNDDILDRAKAKKPVLLPHFAKDATAGVDWAGNSGKLIANLLFKEGTINERYTISSGQNLTWGEVADIYSDLLGVSVEWVSEEAFVENYPEAMGWKKWAYLYDRKFDRLIDNSKVLAATGLTKGDFTPIRDGLAEELKKKGLI